MDISDEVSYADFSCFMFVLTTFQSAFGELANRFEAVQSLAMQMIVSQQIKSNHCYIRSYMIILDH